MSTKEIEQQHHSTVRLDEFGQFDCPRSPVRRDSLTFNRTRIDSVPKEQSIANSAFIKRLLQLTARFGSLVSVDRPTLEATDFDTTARNVEDEAKRAPTLDFSQDRSVERVLRRPIRKRKTTTHIMEAQIRDSKKPKKEWWGGGGKRSKCHRCGQKRTIGHQCRSMFSSKEAVNQQSLSLKTNLKK